jgi:hypothetical protein
MATDTSVTILDIGTTIATSGTLTSVTLAAAPRTPGHWFTLTDTAADGTEITLFNIQTGSTPVPTGTVFPLYDQVFNNLVLKSISPDSKFVTTTNSSARKPSTRRSSHDPR